MKYFLIFALCIIAISAESYIPNSADPDKPDHCYHKDFKLSFKKGDVLKPTNVGQCVELGCQDEGVIRVSQCGRYNTQCKFVPADYTKEYPDCCPHSTCV